MNRIILALDTTNLEESINITKKIKDKICTVKLGLEFFNAYGKEGIKKFNEMGITNLMLDLKLKDIPQTVYRSILALNDINFGYLTIHGQGGKKMIEQAKKAAEKINKTFKEIESKGIEHLNKDGFEEEKINTYRSLEMRYVGQIHECTVNIDFFEITEETLKNIKEDIEKSNKIFLREIGEIPTLFAYPYGETDEKLFNLLGDYKFKVAFGQHSGVVNETSNLYYLPRFSLNEKYGEIDRVKFAATTKGLGVYDFIPSNPTISKNPPFIGFSILDQTIVQSLNCFVFDSEGQVEKELFKFNERIEIRLSRKLNKGRSRINCTAKDKKGNWRWYGHQFYL